jgi:hypothetical protein
MNLHHKGPQSEGMKERVFVMINITSTPVKLQFGLVGNRWRMRGSCGAGKDAREFRIFRDLD